MKQMKTEENTMEWKAMRRNEKKIQNKCKSQIKKNTDERK